MQEWSVSSFEPLRCNSLRIEIYDSLVRIVLIDGDVVGRTRSGAENIRIY